MKAGAKMRDDYWNNTPDSVFLLSRKRPEQEKHTKPPVVWPVGSEEDRRKVLNPLNEWIAKENKLSEWRGIIDTVINRIESYETQWKNDPGNLFPMELLQVYLKDQALENKLRGDRKIIGLLNTRYSSEGVRNFNAMLRDFEQEKGRYLSKHPWPFIDLLQEWRKPNLQILEDIEAICLALSFCHDQVVDSYPILTEQQRETVDSLRYPSCGISVNILENYITHTKIKSPKHKTKKTKQHSDNLPGRPRKYSDEKLNLALEQFEKEMLKNKDATAAWNEVASTYGFPTGEAARKRCEEYRQRRLNHKTGQN